MTRVIRLTLSGLTLAAAEAGRRADGTAANDPPPPKNAIIVLVDTLRSDHIGT